MEVYIPSIGSTKAFRNLVSQQGSGIDEYIYHTTPQHGEGLGNLLGKWFTHMLPLVKRGINSVYNLAKPELKSISNKFIDAGTNFAVKNIKRASSTAKSRLQGKAAKKRKTDYLA